MEFASRFVYAYDLSDEEEVSDEELNDGLVPHRVALSSRWVKNEDNINEIRCWHFESFCFCVSTLCQYFLLCCYQAWRLPGAVNEKSQ